MGSYNDWWDQAPRQPVIADADGKVSGEKLDATLSALKDGDFTALHKHALVEDTPVNAVAATLTTDLTGDDNDLVFTAKTKGVVGNDIMITYVDPGEETATESVEVTGSAIVVTLRSVSSVLSTALEVTAAIEGDAAADALVTVANAAANDGTGSVTEMEAAALADGVDGTTGTAGEMRFDADAMYVCTADNTTADGNWKKVALEALS